MPVIIMAVDDCDEFRLQGLVSGADDYIVKPIKMEELIARVQMLLRRAKSALPVVLTWEKLQFDTSTREVSYKGKRLHLTPKEYGLLELFYTSRARYLAEATYLTAFGYLLSHQAKKQ